MPCLQAPLSLGGTNRTILTVRVKVLLFVACVPDRLYYKLLREVLLHSDSIKERKNEKKKKKPIKPSGYELKHVYITGHSKTADSSTCHGFPKHTR